MTGGDRFILRRIVDGLHVETSDEDVVKEIQARMKPGAVLPPDGRRYALRHHHANQKLYVMVMGN